MLTCESSSRNLATLFFFEWNKAKSLATKMPIQFYKPEGFIQVDVDYHGHKFVTYLFISNRKLFCHECTGFILFNVYGQVTKYC